MIDFLGVVPYDLQEEPSKLASGIVHCSGAHDHKNGSSHVRVPVLAIAKRERWISGTFADNEHLFEISLKPAFPSMNASSGYVTLGVRIVPWQLAWTGRNMWPQDNRNNVQRRLAQTLP